MRSGQLREKIDLLKPVAVRSETGAEEIQWIAHAKGVWAQALPLAGREQFEALTTIADSPVRFRFRYLTGVTAKMRVSHRGTIYKIIAEPVNTGFRDRQIEITCSSSGLEQ